MHALPIPADPADGVEPAVLLALGAGVVLDVEERSVARATDALVAGGVEERGLGRTLWNPLLELLGLD